MKKTTQEILANYNQKVDNAIVQIKEYQNLSNKYSMIRLAIFILAIPALYFIIKTNLAVFFIFLIAVIALFLWAVVKQQKYDKLHQYNEAIKSINENEISTITDHQNLYFDGSPYEIPNHYYTNDLDVFGKHSIFGLINRSRTYFGNQMLKDAFLIKPDKSLLEERQEAIQELVEKSEWRQEVAAKLFTLEDLEEYDVANVIDKQMEMDLSFAENKFINTYRILLPFIWIALLALYFIKPTLANFLVTPLFIGNLLLVGNFTKRINEIQGRLSNTSRSLRQYIDVLHSIFSESWSSKLLKEKAAAFESSTSDMPIKSLSQLSKIIDQLDYRLNFLVAIVLNGFVLWDLRMVNKLSKWKSANTGKLTKVFEHIGFLESMSSLATWAYNHPQYTYPTISADYMSLVSTQIEHPLIPKSQNVENDFTLDKSDKVVIITGSNMSGKSTLLRTLGLNMILGYTGTKVAAAQLDMPIVNIVTYMRIKDALEENVSTFKAELNRIEMILNLLKTGDDTFILIDEMLRGTNSKDKLNGSIGITKKLLESHAYSMIATHDIKLAEMGNENPQIANYYFDIDYQDGDLVFDYKVKDGICENFNASFLLGQLGIETER